MKFLDCVAVVLKHEGGFSMNPKDPGGATNFGITKETLSQWRGRPVTVEEVRDLTIGEARDIYRVWYWDAAECDQLPAGLNLCVFDCAVNQGLRRAILFLQWAVGAIEDAKMGPATLTAVQKHYDASPRSLINTYQDRRLHHYQSLKIWPTFGKGWKNRAEDIRRHALEAVR